MSDSGFQPMMPDLDDTTEYRHITSDFVETVNVDGREILKIDPEGIAQLAAEGFSDTSHLLRPAHLAQLAQILEDPEASENDRFVAMDLLKNANIAAGRILPMCQDTGTAIVMGKKGENVWVEGNDEEAISEGVRRTYETDNLRYSQLAPLDMFNEVNTGDNLPAQIELYAEKGNAYKFMFIAKGGGSANKTFLFQQTKAILNPDSLMEFLDRELRSLGTAACPPYHLAIVIGGTSAEFNLKTVKLASTHYLDNLPEKGNECGQAFRDKGLEAQIQKLTRALGIGAQFGGKYFCHDVRVIRLPRHGASCPVGIGVSCSADRQILGKITKDGLFLEKLETNPARYLPEITDSHLDEDVVKIDLNKPMAEVRAQLSKYPIRTRLSLSGSMIVARDIAHAKLKDLLDNGKRLPDYVKDNAVYYAGPAKTPNGFASGSLGPRRQGEWTHMLTCCRKMAGPWSCLPKQSLPSCNRRLQETRWILSWVYWWPSCAAGPGLHKKVEVLEYPELGMEAIWNIEVEDFPAFIIVDDKGNDFRRIPGEIALHAQTKYAFRPP